MQITGKKANMCKMFLHVKLEFSFKEHKIVINM